MPATTRYLCAIGLVASLGLCVATAGAVQHIEDNFNDNVKNPVIWVNEYSDEDGQIDETNARLEYTSSAAPADENMAKFGLGAALGYNDTWTLTFDAHLGDYGISGHEHDYAVELGVHVVGSGGDNGLFVSFARGEDDGGVPFFGWQAVSEQGEDEDIWHVSATQVDGSLKLVYNEDGAHLFKAYYREAGDWQAINEAIDISGWGVASDDLFSVGLGGFDCGTGIALSDGGKIYADNFVIDIVPEPTTMALLGLGACLPLLRRHRR